jgi:hypothetical protein
MENRFQRSYCTSSPVSWQNCISPGSPPRANPGYLTGEGESSSPTYSRRGIRLLFRPVPPRQVGGGGGADSLESRPSGTSDGTVTEAGGSDYYSPFAHNPVTGSLRICENAVPCLRRRSAISAWPTRPSGIRPGQTQPVMTSKCDSSPSTPCARLPQRQDGTQVSE